MAGSAKFMGGIDGPGGTPPRPIGKTLLILGVVAALVAAVVLLFRDPATEALPETPADPAKTYDATELVGAGDAVPRLASGEMPEVTEVVGLAPTIVVRVHVDERGQVEEARIFRRRPELVAFEEAALNAVRTFTFTPATKDGAPVASWFNYPVVFRDKAGVAETTLQLVGSDTIGGALGPLLARGYRGVRPNVAVSVEALGSSTAFSGLLEGTADIGASSRAISSDELASAKKRGIVLREFVIGYDGIAVVVHPDNPVANLTMAQLRDIYSGAVSNWSALGGDDAAVRLLGRPAVSGTHSMFRKAVLGDRKFADDIESVEHSADIVDAVAGDPAAIAYVGLGWTGKRVRTVGVSDAGDPVLPTAVTVNDGTYPLFRPLFFYTNGTPPPEIADFLRFVVSSAGQKLVVEAGFLARATELHIPVALEGAEASEPTRIYFAKGSDRLDDRAVTELDRLVESLGPTDDSTLLLVPTASEEGDRRADSVHDKLIAAGIPDERIEVDAFGVKAPSAREMSEGTRAATRRVDVFVVPAPPAPEE